MSYLTCNKVVSDNKVTVGNSRLFLKSIHHEVISERRHKESTSIVYKNGVFFVDFVDFHIPAKKKNPYFPMLSIYLSIRKAKTDTRQNMSSTL